MKIFLSYGHDEYATIAQRLKSDLESNGFEVWIDKEQIKGTADWEISIEKGISSSDWIVLLMTEHSVRRPDGVCLDEVSFARFLGKSIVPIMVQDVKPPLCIARIQWLDMQNFLNTADGTIKEDDYLQKKEELLAILNGIGKLNSEVGAKTLKQELNPLDNDVYSERFRQNFFGRQALLNYYDNWYASGDKVLWLVGDAGIGKTAFIANLCVVRDNIQAVHFCRYNDNERANAKRAVMSLAYYLATQISEYKRYLENEIDLSNLIDKDVTRLFEYLIVEPLNKITYTGKPVVIVIDALDEATVNGKNELVDVISKHIDETPAWLKLLLTSRKDSLLERKLAKFKAVDFADSQVNDNSADIRGYFESRLGDLLPAASKRKAVLDSLTERSGGIFLYAKTVADEIIKGRRNISDIDNFPEGLTGIYVDYFDRIFNDGANFSYKRDIRPVMEILCTTCEPLRPQTICDILNLDDYDFEEMCELFNEMFPVRNNVLEPIHKSIIDWLIDPKKSGDYRVSAKKGNEKIAEYYLGQVKKGKLSDYSVKYLCTHLLNVENDSEAVELLTDEAFIDRRIKVMGLDSAVRLLLNELKRLKEFSESSLNKVFCGAAFIRLFTEHRKFFYNSGLYFALKELDFSEFLSTGGAATYNSVNSLIGIAYFYYITESFKKAIECVENLLNGSLKMSYGERAELHNLIALCYRKSVDFDKSEQHFKEAFDTGKNDSSYYDRSISLINLGKIAYHKLDWQAAAEWNKEAIEYLKKEIDISSNNDYRTSLMLFVAEYHRLTAECIIWSGDLKAVNRELEYAEEIYNGVKTRDRYYIRFLYTKTFRDVLAKEYKSVYENCERLLEQATSSYDKSQILFYRGIAALKLKRYDECFKFASEAYNYAKSIGAWLETEEAYALCELSGVKHNFEHCEYFAVNKFITRWIEHVYKFINELGD